MSTPTAEQLEADAMKHRTTGYRPAVALSTGSDPQPIWERIAELAATLPEEAIAGLPTDGASQLDHYLYGVPKRNETVRDSSIVLTVDQRAAAEGTCNLLRNMAIEVKERIIDYKLHATRFRQSEQGCTGYANAMQWTADSLEEIIAFLASRKGNYVTGDDVTVSDCHTELGPLPTNQGSKS